MQTPWYYSLNLFMNSRVNRSSSSPQLIAKQLRRALFRKCRASSFHTELSAKCYRAKMIEHILLFRHRFHHVSLEQVRTTGGTAGLAFSSSCSSVVHDSPFSVANNRSTSAANTPATSKGW